MLSDTENRMPKRVVIVGAGFGGLQLAKALRRSPVEVTLIDRNNYHTFQPLLYQVATAALEADEIAGTIRAILRKNRNFSFRLGAVTGIDWGRNNVELADGGNVPFDFLVLAAGTSTNTFGIPGVSEHALSLKSLDDAVALRNHIIRQFERTSADARLINGGSLNFVVVGGGPTGVETAGALRELFVHVLRRDFPAIDITQTRVILVEALDQLLAPFESDLGQYALEILKRRGVETRLGQAVDRVTPDSVVLASGEEIPAGTVIWSAGVRANLLADQLGLGQTRGGRIVVNPDLSVPGQPNVFVIGDMSGATDADGNLLPQLAPVALQGASHVATQLRRIAQGEATQPFVYHDKGIMATIGRGAAITQLPSGFKLRGWLGWFVWAVVHLTQIVGLRNKVYVYLNWVYNYFTYDRSARLLLDPEGETKRSDRDSIHDRIVTPDRDHTGQNRRHEVRQEHQN
jgi:NADH dehydrogenase